MPRDPLIQSLADFALLSKADQRAIARLLSPRDRALLQRAQQETSFDRPKSQPLKHSSQSLRFSHRLEARVRALADKRDTSSALQVTEHARTAVARLLADEAPAALMGPF
ncbi:MAG: hypothetical protein ABW199_08930 [Caulobacterales bacterium]